MKIDGKEMEQFYAYKYLHEVRISRDNQIYKIQRRIDLGWHSANYK
jgi:hypothetical protein